MVLLFFLELSFESGVLLLLDLSGPFRLFCPPFKVFKHLEFVRFFVSSVLDRRAALSQVLSSPANFIVPFDWIGSFS